MRDSEIIREKLLPIMMELGEEGVEPTSVAMFFAHYLSELLKEIGSRPDREKILKRMLD